MPIYEYKCAKGRRYETIQSMSEDKITRCPFHKNCSTQRLVSAPNIRLNAPGTMTDTHLYKELEID